MTVRSVSEMPVCLCGHSYGAHYEGHTVYCGQCKCQSYQMSDTDRARLRKQDGR